MAEAWSSEVKRSRLSLSLSKNKKKKGTKKDVEIKGTQSGASTPPSIVSFFSNVPPAKITCPMCGHMVPRYGINEHMDEMCQGNHGTVGVAASTISCFMNERPLDANMNNNSSSYFSKKRTTLEANSSKNSLLKTEVRAAQQVSPYFNSNNSACNVHNESWAQKVKVISLGSLSSKLSRRRRIQEGKQIVYKETDSLSHAVPNICKSSAALDEEEICAGHSSQKENQLVQREEQNPSKKEPELQEEINKCHGEDFVDVIQVSLPADTINGRRLAFGTRSTKTESSSEGVLLGSDKLDARTAIYTATELTSGLEVKTQPHTQGIPSSRTEASSNRQNCFKEDDVQVLPVEVHEDFKDEINPSLSETVEKVEFHNSIDDILDKINDEVRSVPNSPGHPYYLQNFLVVLRAVLENEDDVRLFNDQDIHILTKFCQLSVGGQKLYVRLFQRKLNWIKVNKIEYGEISVDLLPVIEELIEASFLQTESELEDLCEGLDLLSAPELKTLAKIFHLPNPNGQKQQLVDDFLRLAKQRSVFSKSQTGIGTVILKRAKDLAGKSVRVCKGPRAVFSRVLLLFSLSEPMEDEEAGSGGQGQLSTVLMVNMGRMAFPSYTVNRKTEIFQDRDDLIRYATAAHLSNDIATSMANGNWAEANRLYTCAKETWNELKNQPSLSHHRALPEYLRRFTVGWVYTRILSQGVEILQRLHMYKEAVQELQNLLSQEVYCTDSRGRWWDRLALNLHQHLKNTKKAIDCIRNGLADPFVRTGHRFSLYQRALRIRDSPSCKQFRSLLHDLPVITVEDVTHGFMEKVQHLLHCMDFSCGISYSWMTYPMFSEIAIRQLLRAVIYLFIQTSPLDLYTDSFYENRRDVIEARLQQLHTASSATLTKLITDIWTTQEGKAAALVSWGRFISLQQVQSLVSCLGGMFLSGVFRRLSKDLRHCKGGLPDLVVWSTHSNHFKLVEVKGPNDRLSYKQIIWLSELKKLGAAVEVCHVQAVGAKSKRLSWQLTYKTHVIKM
ncbi:fanconi-associated nuclease 1 isoform X2 [Struthio camelus]|uniref:fanconi-associated nuclease 1 isoform X2 n=1 Tax=Struthio camelus TaxID=8801 RepID=UPI003603B609